MTFDTSDLVASLPLLFLTVAGIVLLLLDAFSRVVLVGREHHLKLPAETSEAVAVPPPGSRNYLMPVTLLFLLGALAAVSLWTPASYAQAPESSDPIKIALFDWTSVNLNAKIMGGILEKLGYTVEYPTADYLSSLTTGLTNGDLTVGMEFWATTTAEGLAALTSDSPTKASAEPATARSPTCSVPICSTRCCPKS